MIFYSTEMINKKSIDKSAMFPIYICEEIKNLNGIKNTTIRLTKIPTNTVYAYCNVSEFKISDMFKYKIQKEDKENNPNTIQPRNATTIKKTKQANLFSFMKKNK